MLKERTAMWSMNSTASHGCRLTHASRAAPWAAPMRAARGVTSSAPPSPLPSCTTLFCAAFVALLLAGVAENGPRGTGSPQKGEEAMDLFERLVVFAVPVTSLWSAVTLAVYAVGTLFGAEWRLFL